MILKKSTLFKFDVLQTPSEARCSITSEIGALSPAELSCTCGSDCGDMSVLLLLSVAKLGYWLGVSMRSPSRYGVN